MQESPPGFPGGSYAISSRVEFWATTYIKPEGQGKVDKRARISGIHRYLTCPLSGVQSRGLKEYKEGKTRSLDDVVRDRVAV